MPRKTITPTGLKSIIQPKVIVNGAPKDVLRQVVMVNGEPQTAWQQRTLYGLVFTGTQYIDSLFSPKHSSRVEIDTVMTTAVGNRAVFGARSGYNLDSFVLWCYAEGTPRSDYNVSNIGMSSSIMPFNQRLHIDKNRNVTYVDGVIGATSPAGTFSCAHNLFIGCLNHVGSPSNFYTGTVYSCKIYDNNVLVRDFVPVPMGSTAYSATPAPSNCLWDMCAQQYFENAGSGTFGIVTDI